MRDAGAVRIDLGVNNRKIFVIGNSRLSKRELVMLGSNERVTFRKANAEVHSVYSWKSSEGPKHRHDKVIVSS